VEAIAMATVIVEAIAMATVTVAVVAGDIVVRMDIIKMK